MSRLRQAAFFLILVFLPQVFDYAFRKDYPVHTHGAVIISGCSRGIGKHAAFQLARQGYNVFASVQSEDEINVLKNEFFSESNMSENLIPFVLDVTDKKSIDYALEKVSSFIEKNHLPFVGVVNNAEVAKYSPFETENLDFLKAHFDANFFGAISLTQKFLPLIRRDKGRVIFVSSVAGFSVTSGTIAFATSKHALEAAADALRLEMEEFQVSVSVVQPGVTNNTMEQQISPKKKSRVSDEQKKIYRKFWDWLRSSSYHKVHSDGDHIAVISDAIVHALTDRYPKVKYAVGEIGGIPVPFSVFVDSFLPDPLVDRLKFI